MDQKAKFAKELHHRVVDYFRRRPIICTYNNDTWSIDLLDISRYATLNKKINFLLVVIDNFSRYLWVVPLKNKNAETVLNAFKSVVKMAGNTPENLWSDDGTEFKNIEFKKYCTSNNINLYSTFSGLKAVIAERVNRTIRAKISKYMTETNQQKYIDHLPLIVKEYNETEHHTIKTTPKSVYYGDAIPEIPDYIIDDFNPKFKIGDYVRISIVKNLFEKGTAESYSREVYKITGIDNTQSPINYTIEDLMGEAISGKFYEAELLKSELPDYKEFGSIVTTKTENRVKKYLVSYKGWASKWNEWKTGAEVKAMGGILYKKRRKRRDD